MRLPRKKYRKHRLFPLFALLLLAIGPFAAKAAEEVVEVRDAVLAVVDRDVITRTQVLNESAERLRDVPAGLSADERDRLVAEVLAYTLRRMIDEKLIASEGQRLLDANEPFRLRVEEQVTQRLEDERRKAGGETAFRDKIRETGLSFDEYRKKIQQEIIQQVVIVQFVLRDLSVSPEELRLQYQEHLDRFRETSQVKYRQIFIRADQYESRQKAREVADYVMELLGKQADFARLATDYSNGPRAQEGGLYDFQNRGARPAPIDERLFSLTPGQVGGPVETEQGFTILRVEERKEGRLRPFEEVQSEIELDLLNERRARRYNDLINRLQREHHVEMML
jgi:parvulin-like peptidyl-prolyl isomerase